MVGSGGIINITLFRKFFPAKLSSTRPKEFIFYATRLCQAASLILSDFEIPG